MRTLILAALVLTATPSIARAEVGLGIFIGEPLGVDVKIDLKPRQALDLVFGVTDTRYRDYSYGHITYLVTPLVGRGRSVLVPVRLGIGAALFGIVEEDINIAARAPLEIALLFRRTPMEIYGEIAFKFTFVREGGGTDYDLDGGIGLRFYFL